MKVRYTFLCGEKEIEVMEATGDAGDSVDRITLEVTHKHPLQTHDVCHTCGDLACTDGRFGPWFCPFYGKAAT